LARWPLAGRFPRSETRPAQRSRLRRRGARELLIQIAHDGGYIGVDIDTLSESLNYLVHGAWYWDHLNPSSRDTDVLRKTMLLLHQAFPRHFELMR